MNYNKVEIKTCEKCGWVGSDENCSFFEKDDEILCYDCYFEDMPENPKDDELNEDDLKNGRIVYYSIFFEDISVFYDKINGNFIIKVKDESIFSAKSYNSLVKKLIKLGIA